MFARPKELVITICIVLNMVGSPFREDKMYLFKKSVNALARYQTMRKKKALGLRSPLWASSGVGSSFSLLVRVRECSGNVFSKSNVSVLNCLCSVASAVVPLDMTDGCVAWTLDVCWGDDMLLYSGE
jgi:hypothetical protein